jgi:hypothetical protein
MEAVLEHLKEYTVGYSILVVCLIPALFFTRKWSLPLILFTIETGIYLCIVHIVTHYIVAMTKWFKINSSMKALREDGTPVDAPTWETPLMEFWMKELYDPKWMVWVEAVLAVVIIFLVFRYRPLKVQHKSKRRMARERAQEKKKSAAQKRSGNHSGRANPKGY